MDTAAGPPAPSHVIVTGAGGFVGRRLVQRLVKAGAIVTGIGRGDQPPDWPTNAHWVRADIGDPQRYEAALTRGGCVVHLAAITGKASRDAFMRGNVEATRALLNASARAGVDRFIFVSTIATSFADRRHYGYADSKLAAEALVRAAPLASLIVRPTMIMGPESPIEKSLVRFATLPIAPIFGDGKRQVQPVDVEDVADFLAALVNATDVRGEVIDLGGPLRYDLRELYQRLRASRNVGGSPVFLHLPLGLTRWTLATVERPLLPLLPLTAGQLATFANDGVASASDTAARLLPIRRTSPRPNSATAPGDERAGLAEEGRRFMRYVFGAPPSQYQLEKYVELHSQRSLTQRNAFDGMLLGVARSSWLGLAFADSYSGTLMRTSLVRAKLIAALAIGESSGSSSELLAEPDRGKRLVLGKMAMRAALGVLTLSVAALLLGPFHLLLRGAPKERPG